MADPMQPMVSQPYGNSPSSLSGPVPDVNGPPLAAPPSAPMKMPQGGGAGAAMDPNDLSGYSQQLQQLSTAPATAASPTPPTAMQANTGEQSWLGIPKPSEQAYDAGAQYAKDTGFNKSVLDNYYNMAGGLTKTGVAQLAALVKSSVTGEPLAVGAQDWIKLAQAKPPSTHEFLQNLGVGKGWSVNVLGQEMSVRGAAGMIGDIASAGGIKAAMGLASKSKVISSLVNTPGPVQEAVAEAVQGVASRGSTVATSAGELAQNAQSTLKVVNGIQTGLSKVADAVGAVAKPEEMSFSATKDVLTRMEAIPQLKAAAATMREGLEQFSSQPQSVSALAKFREAFTSATLDMSDNPAARNMAGKLFSAASADSAKIIDSVANAKLPGLGSGINTVINEWGKFTGQFADTHPLAKAAKLALAVTFPKSAIAVGALKIATNPTARARIGNALLSGANNGLAGAMGAAAVAPYTPPMQEGQ